MVLFPVTLSDPSPRFEGHGVVFMPIGALSVFCAQLTCDMLAIAKFLFSFDATAQQRLDGFSPNLNQRTSYCGVTR